MTDLPYTDADLRHEAAYQHHQASTDHYHDEITRYMHQRTIPSNPATRWADLTETERAAASEAVATHIENAADLSTWAVNLGADGLTPDPHHADFGHHPDKPIPLMRIHFAFHPEADNTDRHDLAQLATEAVQNALNHALND